MSFYRDAISNMSGLNQITHDNHTERLIEAKESMIIALRYDLSSITKLINSGQYDEASELAKVVEWKWRLNDGV